LESRAVPRGVLNSLATALMLADRAAAHELDGPKSRHWPELEGRICALELQPITAGLA